MLPENYIFNIFSHLELCALHFHKCFFFSLLLVYGISFINSRESAIFSNDVILISSNENKT